MQSSKSMLVYLGANTHEKLVHQLLEINPKTRFLASHIFPEAPLALLDDEEYNNAVINFDSSVLINSGEIQITSINDCNVLSIINEIMNDKHLSLLWTRFNNKIRRKNASEVKRYEVVYSLIKSSLETCLTLKPDLVVFSYEPHMLPVYVFKRVATALGIKTFTLTISPFVWRLFCETNEDTGSVELLKNNKESEVDLLGESVKKLIKEKQGHYREAKPFYEKRDSKNKLGLGLLKKLKVNGWRPRKAMQSHMSLKEYQRAVSLRDEFENVKYISLFLQYQPEQTTLPDGQLFVHQLFAIQMLYTAASSLGISLVIREHPATFDSTFDPKWRPQGFYRTIKKMGNEIYFDNTDEDPFTLIENSIAVSSISGSVLLEGMLRGKPAISFGKHTLNGLDTDAFVYSFLNEKELRDKIIKASMMMPKDIVSHIEQYLYDVYPATFGARQYLGNDLMSLEELRESRFKAMIHVFKQLSEEV